MQENLTIARPYAQAAFETACEAGEVERWDDALQLLGAMVDDPQMRRLLSDPAIGRDRIVDLLVDVAGERFPASFRNLVRVLAAARRLDVAPQIARVFAERRAARDNVAHVEVVSAFPLDSDIEQRIATTMQQRLGKEIRITQTIDPALIGGARVKVGDVVYDASLKGGLSQLANAFNLK